MTVRLSVAAASTAFVVVCLVTLASCAEEPRRQVTSKDLMLAQDPSVDPPETLDTARVGWDLAILKHALEHGYGGRHLLSEDTVGSVMDELDELAGRDIETPEDLCWRIADAVWPIPDSHLYAYVNNRLCGDRARAARRKPSVGKNIATKVGDPPPIWNRNHVSIAGHEIPILSITRMPDGEDSAWEGFTAVLKGLARAPAVIVDLRGNGGGSDARGFELASALLGFEASAFNSITTRQQPETFVLRMNATLMERQQLLNEGADVPPYLGEQLDEFRTRYEQAIAGKLEPEDHVLLPVPDEHEQVTAFTGPIVVLADAGCASSCEGTLIALKRHPRVRIFGEPTGGYLHFGNTGLLVLPHSRVRLSIPSTSFELIGGGFHERDGIPPDVVVPAGTDALEAAQAWLGDELRSVPSMSP